MSATTTMAARTRKKPHGLGDVDTGALSYSRSLSADRSLLSLEPRLSSPSSNLDLSPSARPSSTSLTFKSVLLLSHLGIRPSPTSPVLPDAGKEPEHLPADLLELLVGEPFYGLVRFIVPTTPGPLYFPLLRGSGLLNLCVCELYCAYLTLVVIDPSLRMNHDLVVAASVRLFDGVVGVQARLAVSAHLEALQNLAIGQKDQRAPDRRAYCRDSSVQPALRYQSL